MTYQGREYVVRRKDLLYPELSFKINGVLIEVFKQLGGGHRESYYQKGVAAGLTKEALKFEEQYYVPLKCFDSMVGKYYLDFLIDDKIVLELKRGQFVSAQVIAQTKQYLVALNLKLAIVACFTHSGVVIKRVINEY
ncbi:MAG: hypothetical protein A2921_00870 [Candidatus Magasanikbacteria bacterium RIFCSPLOWO2_01_FULL_43_20b]|uniref:GxxExxY protein n=1 Tax=Candidatus Magasanikbacteria bacterium RIFCSPLOWO2_12_FULL_43_12 TaxID=1798692 RepID=A0A1F6MVD4_9BACT|nr:MAG: hypothetical protein A3I93_00590 [Candidatus Magasanikbacteria bacterium RIFCSPLOWO2_02_FULL_43_22]OGH72831.1 MAG: hypothetical protein A2921_00870 [Candidatus Magasanikbacteria bacterium RIFCSPLOWO2_01_FULL_43_20b]OGH75627.1 MAG: hypothetical protein A3G00_03985 [Candidatus Magasanikbacteria bacterium RIFCSPLOWO2_12_FULL_43_12]